MAEPVANVLQVTDQGATPPTTGEAYPVRMPAIDEDGMPQGGVREPYIAAPLGTYWGWNLRDEGFVAGDLRGLAGQLRGVPDVRDGGRPPSVSARYNGRDGYRQAARAAAEELVEANLIRAQDVELVVEDAPDLQPESRYSSAAGARM